MVAKDYPTNRIFSVQNLAHNRKVFTQQGSTTNTTMASMAHQTAAGMTALKPSSRKQRRDFIRREAVTTDPNDLIQSDNEEEEEEVPRKMDAKLGQKHAYEIHHPYLQLLKSEIK
ncbi:hypothetical protein MHU86_24172 [Fragilaria crotonensis]|nr:hypothetical protein MHU86_24172 [Fragilaria crotonensis]